MSRKEFDTVKNPKTNLWYVIGYCGRNKKGQATYIPISDGFKTKSEATKYIPHLKAAIKDQSGLDTI